MNLSTLLPALILGGIGIALAVGIVVLVVRSLFGVGLRVPSLRSLLSFRDGLTLTRFERRLMEFDRLRDEGGGHGPTEVLRGAFCFSTVRSDVLVERIKSHNMATFERALRLADDVADIVPALEKLELLLEARHDLLGLYVRTATVSSRIAEKRKVKEKALPEWSRAEYSRKLQSIAEELLTNERAFLRVFDELEGIVKTTPSPEQIVYH